MDTSYSLVVKFPDESETFVLGFEAGIIWEKMSADVVKEINTTVHTLNLECIRRMCVATEWDMVSTPTSIEGWTFIELRKAAQKQRSPWVPKIVR